MEPILVEWERFARTILPATKAMTQDELRDEAREILEAIAADMETAQSPKEKQAKSEGRVAGRALSVANEAATSHGAERLSVGFGLEEMVSEYRALRASVIRLWTQNMGEADRSMLDELTRFNEAIDEALTASIERYAQGIGRSKDLMMAALGHDLRTPLGAIVNSANLLLRTKDMSTRGTQAASRILSSATRMAQMVSDLLDFTRTRLGEVLPIDPASMDLGEACRLAIDEIAAVHSDAIIQFEPSGELSGTWDAVRIAQLLSNLIGNAVQHGRKGTPVRIAAHGDDEKVILTVHNEGQAIPEDRIERLFEPLARATERSNSAGLGLGLYISREIVRAHRGTIEVSSSKDGGTTFRVCLPRS